MTWLSRIRRGLFGGGTPTYDGVGSGRRAIAWQVANPGAVAALAFSQNELRAKSRDLVRRNAWAAAGESPQEGGVRGVEEIVSACGVRDWLVVEIHQSEQEIYRQLRRGRPGKYTKFKRTVQIQYTISWQINALALEDAAKDDGVFPLITNRHDWDTRRVLEAYKRQPIIEKRFSQLKTDFCVAPVYLKNVGRIVGLLAVYFFALIVQTLLERELRRAMKAQRVATLPLYPEGRPCSRPTTRHTIDAFENIQRHTIQRHGAEDELLVTDLSPLQQRLLELLNASPKNYGR